MADAAPGLDALLAEPQWFLHRLDPAARRALFVRLDRDAMRAAAFLDERVLVAQPRGCWTGLDELVARASVLPRPTPHAIFHIGHCGSTLVANLLDRLPGTLALREPLVLRTLAELREELPRATARYDLPRWRALFDAVVALLGRAHDDLRPLVKATSNCNALIEPWLERDAGAKLLLLHVALEPWLATLLKSPAARADAVRFAPARLAYLHAALGDDTLRLHGLSDAEQLALGWLAERLRFANAAAASNGRAMRLDFADLLREGPPAFARVAAHFGLAHDAESVARAWHPDVLGRYAKAREHAYSPDDRDADLAESRRRHGGEIAAALRYADTARVRFPALGD
ncbi:MAG TPA: hypothetical protein VND91_06375 [Candidatus Saccharimonadia bacterium]|nr:hypothetical protein [Candidatus Saccharimonadia bacterium]